jgi:hypothetical protein
MPGTLFGVSFPPLSTRTCAGLAAAFGTALAAQAPLRPLPHPLEPRPEWQRAVSDGIRTADGRPGPAHWRDGIRYRLTAELDPVAARVQGRAEIDYRNGSPAPMTELVLHLRQNLHRASAVRNIQVEVTDGMELGDTTLDGEPCDVQVSGTVARVYLPQPLAPGASTQFTADFAFTVPDGEAPRMGREGHELFFLGYWYPQCAVRDGVRDWTAEQYLGESEFFMPYADYEVEFTAPHGWLVQATGALQNPGEVLTERAQQALDSAATSRRTVPVISAADVENGELTAADQDGDGRLVWRFRAEHVRDFAISTANCYRWDAASAEVGDRDGDGSADRCVVHTFYRPGARSWARSCRFAQHTIESLSRQLVPYPWPHASVVEGILGGGMEYPMLVLCGDQMAPLATQSLIAHELAHMWFPMLVGNDETAHGWQDEGLVDFLTAILVRDFWKLRRPSEARTGYLDWVRSGFEREPLLDHSDHLAQPGAYVFACYTKPAAVLEQLAAMLGEERVIGALREYTRSWQHEHPLPEDFFAAMDRALGEDLGWYWSTWWSEIWTLDHAIGAVRATADGKGTEVVIEDRGRAPHPALVRVRYLDGSRAAQTVPVATWLAGARSAVLTFGPGVDEVTIDPDQRTLDVQPDNNRWSAQ